MDIIGGWNGRKCHLLYYFDIFFLDFPKGWGITKTMIDQFLSRFRNQMPVYGKERTRVVKFLKQVLKQRKTWVEVQIFLGMDYNALRALLDYYHLEINTELKLKTKKKAQAGKPEPEGDQPDHEEYIPPKY